MTETNKETLLFIFLLPIVLPIRFTVWLLYTIYLGLIFIGKNLYYFAYDEYPRWERKEK